MHDDVFAVLKFSTQEMMNAEQAERVMKSWREFVEPFFGISRADPEGDYVDDSAEQAAVFVRKDEEDEEENDEGEHDGEGSDKPASGDDAADAEMEDADENKARKEKDSEEEEDDEAPGKKRKATAAGKGAKGKKAKKEESEEEEEAESDEDDEEEKLYAACKPLSGAVVSSDEETVAATPLEKLDGRVFYGHDGYYMLFRLHQHLYERLSTARASAASMSQQFGQKAQPEAVRAAKEREIHNDFLRLLFKLLNGTVESSNFEDDCRTLLGANLYVLFTLDKLIYKIVKQIQSLLADENATKLLHLLEYEKQRKSPFVEAIYHANASVLLLDESCYRFGSEDGGASLTLQLMDSGLDKADLPAGTMEAQFHDYLESFLRTSADEEDEEDEASRGWRIATSGRTCTFTGQRRRRASTGVRMRWERRACTTRWSARSPAATRRFRTFSTPRMCFIAEWALARVRVAAGASRGWRRPPPRRSGPARNSTRGSRKSRRRCPRKTRRLRRPKPRLSRISPPPPPPPRSPTWRRTRKSSRRRTLRWRMTGTPRRRRRAKRTMTTKPSKPKPPRTRRWRTPRVTSKTSRRRRRNDDYDGGGAGESFAASHA